MAKGGPAVTIVSSGGIPVTQVSGGGNASPFTVVTNGGFPVQLVSTLGIAVALYDTSGNEYSSGGGGEAGSPIGLLLALTKAA